VAGAPDGFSIPFGSGVEVLGCASFSTSETLTDPSDSSHPLLSRGSLVLQSWEILLLTMMLLGGCLSVE